MGMALTSCTVPAAGKPTFELGDDEMEIGIGIHGEPGRERMKMKPVAEIVEMMATAIVDDLPYASGDKVLAFVNGMGGTPLIELYVVFNELNRFLQGRGITISRNLIGDYITSLEMQGCSITLLKLDDDLTKLWDAPVEDRRPALGGLTDRRRVRSRPRGSAAGAGSLDEEVGVSVSYEDAVRCVRAYADVIAENKEYLTQLDSAIGDADHGINMNRGFQAVLGKLDGVPNGDVGNLLKTVGHDARLDRRRGRRPAVRDAVPAVRRGDGRQGRARGRGLGGGARRRRRRACRCAARPNPATRRWSTL